MMIQLVTTAQSVEQAEALIKAGTDRLYIGSSRFGLRQKGDWTIDAVREVTQLAHRYGKEVTVAVNNLMHNEHIQELPDYLQALKAIGVDDVTAGDPGAIRLIRQAKIPYWYDAQTLVTSSKQIQFWAKREAIGAVVAREVTLEELVLIQQQIGLPVEVQVYGPTCIHHSKRPLVTNYFNELGRPSEEAKQREFYMSEPADASSRYPIYEDENGTHIFSEDLTLMAQLPTLVKHGLHTWKLDGWHAGEQFVEIVQLFTIARANLLNGQFDRIEMEHRLRELQPEAFRLGTGLLLRKPEEIK
ncbi:peptidase U32 family protein [Exiguobacterium aestuarii]|uniref:Peptidase U32 family protein n=1 Tax=Exiguobacterium aestuarii TaxID=273527 RepID=A0ABW2PJJ3_9BACL|nr:MULTISPECIES: peptidase U32 family protein [Exiguobacterium]MCT4785670.1 U32 family peptidase [Exiguobacterium aestuarii]